MKKSTRAGHRKFPPLHATLLLAACMMPHASFAAPKACTCKDLPALVKEIIEQEYLGKLFDKWSGYMPRENSSIGAMQSHAQSDFNAHFYSSAGSTGSGTQDGGHAALGTLYASEDCGIGEFQYNRKGQPINRNGEPIVPESDDKPAKTPPKDNEQWIKPISEEDYIKSGKQCEALVRYAWIHEKVHQKTCQDLRAQGNSQRWNSVEFFAGNDAKAYKAGADYLRQITKDLALSCGWEGSTAENAVPPPPRAKGLAQQAAKITKSRSTKANAGGGKKNVARVITGTVIDDSPMDELITRWSAQCSDDSAPGCGALGASIEISLVQMIRDLQRQGVPDRQTLFDAAHANSAQLKELAMNLLSVAQSPEEVDFALRMTEHSSPAVREAAKGMLQNSEDPRWQPIKRWWRSDRGDERKGVGSALVPGLEPRANDFGVDTLEGLQHRPFGSNADRVMFTTTQPIDAVVKRLGKGKTIMPKESDVKNDTKSFEETMKSVQQEIMAAIQSGDMKKMNELSAKMMDAQKKISGTDFAAVNTDENSIGILLEKDKKTGLPLSVVRVKRDEAWGQTVVIFERNRVQ